MTTEREEIERLVDAYASHYRNMADFQDNAEPAWAMRGQLMSAITSVVQERDAAKALVAGSARILADAQARIAELESDCIMLRRSMAQAETALHEGNNEWIRRFNERVDKAALAPENQHE